MARSMRRNSFPGVQDCRAQFFVQRLTLIDADDSDGAGPNVQADDGGAGLSAQRRQAFLNKLDEPANLSANGSAADPAIFVGSLKGLGLPGVRDRGWPGAPCR